MDEPLHIAIAGRALDLPFGGVKTAVLAILRELAQIGAPHRFTLYTPDARHAIAGMDHVTLRAPHKALWDHAVLPLRLAHQRPDVVWFPHNVISLGWHGPSVVTIYDLAYFPVPQIPAREYAPLDAAYMRLAIPPSLRSASRVMAISRWTADEAVHWCGTDPAKMAVIPLAVDPLFRPIVPELARSIVEPLIGDGPFFLYAGGLSPRKNIRMLVESFGAVAAYIPHRLVITAGILSGETSIADLIERYQLHGRVLQIGEVGGEQLRALYNTADALVYPSLYEGFGLPPLEAMACGCLAICSDATSLPEVVGDAALLLDPHDGAVWSDALLRCANDDALRHELRAARLRRAAQFSWARTARALLGLLENAVRERDVCLS